MKSQVYWVVRCADSYIGVDDWVVRARDAEHYSSKLAAENCTSKCSECKVVRVVRKMDPVKAKLEQRVAELEAQLPLYWVLKCGRGRYLSEGNRLWTADRGSAAHYSSRRAAEFATVKCSGCRVVRVVRKKK